MALLREPNRELMVVFLRKGASHPAFSWLALYGERRYITRSVPKDVLSEVPTTLCVGKWTGCNKNKKKQKQKKNKHTVYKYTTTKYTIND